MVVYRYTPGQPHARAWRTIRRVRGANGRVLLHARTAARSCVSAGSLGTTSSAWRGWACIATRPDSRTPVLGGLYVECVARMGVYRYTPGQPHARVYLRVLGGLRRVRGADGRVSLHARTAAVPVMPPLASHARYSARPIKSMLLSFLGNIVLFFLTLTVLYRQQFSL